jgi:LPXTG-site transpeptidase (sortase) family protein
MMKSFFSLLLAFVLSISMTLAQFSPAYAASLPAEINQQFTPLQIDTGGVSVLKITIFNPNIYALSAVAFTDHLLAVQPGLFIGSAGLKTNTCGGTVTATPGATDISLSGGSVPAQAATPGQCYIEVYISSVTAGNLINTIASGALTATGSEGTVTNTSPASATISVIAVDPPSMSKTFAPNTIYVGQTSQLTIRINNNDPDTTLTNASFTDSLPTGVVLATPASLVVTGCGTGTVTAVDGGASIALSNGTITPATDCVIKANVTGTSGIYTNTIPAGPLDPNSLKTQQGVTNTTDVQANLNIQPVAVSKAFSPATIDAGDTSTLTITLQNPTNAAYTGVSISDTLPTGLTFTGTSATTCVGGAVTTTVGTPATLNLTGGAIPAKPTPTTMGTCTITATVKADLTAAGKVTNTIPKNALSADQPGVTNISPVTADITVTPALTATKFFAAPYAIALGGTNEVTVTLFNNSSTALTGVTFTDALPSGLIISGTPASPQCNGGIVTSAAASATLTGGSIPGNSNCTIKFFITNASATAGTYSNSIGAGDITTAQCSPTCVGNNTAITTSHDLTVVNASQLPVEVSKVFAPSSSTGSTSRLTITITAPLDLPINRIHFTDTLPVGVTVAATPNAAVSCPGGTTSLDLSTPTQIVFNDTTSVTTLAAGTSCTIAVDVTAGPGLYTNNIPVNAITTAQGRTNELTAATANLSLTSMTMSKAFYPATVQADGKSTLTITLQNTSSSNLTNVNLTDILPGTTTDGLVVYGLVNNTCGGTINPVANSQNIELTGGTIPAQVGVVPGICTISVDVQGKDSSPSSSSSYNNTIPVTNVTATVGAAGPTIQPLSPAQATLNIKSLKIGVVKGFDPVLVYGGATSTMSVQLNNPNSVVLTGVAFTDAMDSLSPGIVLADPPVFNTGTCGGTLTGTPGNASFTFSDGILYPNATCTLTLKVLMAVNGNRTNRIPAGAVTTFNGVKSDQPTEASLTNLPGVGVTKMFDPSSVTVGQVSKLTITISNTSNVPVVNMGLLDNFPNLPTGLVIAGGADYLATNDCTSTGAPATLTATAGAGTINLAGGSLAKIGDPSGYDSCTIQVNVVSSSIGAFVNMIPAGKITADDGVTNNNPATDTLRVGGLFSLGNRVWFDTNNDGSIDGSEVGVDGVTVQLYSASDMTTVRGTQVTSQGGYYRFDDLEPGDYVVVIPKDNFTDIGAGDLALTDPLASYWSSGSAIAANGTVTDSTSNDPDDNIDSDDNGIAQTSGAFAGAVISNPITLGPGAIEPINESDKPLANPAGEAPDAQSNLTLDFGFYRGSLGNQVFLDSNGNGTYDGSPDLPIESATVQLFASDGTHEIITGADGIFGTADDGYGPDGVLGGGDDGTGGVLTDTDGTYSFGGLSQGNYVIKVTPPTGMGYTSTIDSADTTNPNNNINNNDNGVGTATGQVSSNPVTLTPGSTGAASNNTVTNLDGTTYNPTLDFGFLLYSLGNRVWYDTNNDGVLQATEVGIEGVRVELYQDNGSVAGLYDAGDTFIGYDETDASGYYRFDQLAAGNYVVVIPADNFRNVGAGDNMGTDPLANYWSSGVSVNSAGTLSEPPTPLPNLDHDASSNILTSDENGITTFSSALISSINPINYVSSAAVTLGGLPLEPTGETAPNGQGSTDDHANMTVDFGFYQAGIGDLVFADFNESGAYETNFDATLENATVQVFTSGGVEVPVGADGILGTSDDATGGVVTDATGIYSFSGLPSGDYIIKATPPDSSYVTTNDLAAPLDTANPDLNVNNNDNGINATSQPNGQVSSGDLTLNPTTDSGTYIITDNAAGSTTDTSLDFGFISPFYSLGNRVWLDTNNSGAIDLGESGVSGVRVELYAADAGGNPTGPMLNSMLTDANGYYRFDSLTAGDYVVTIPNDNFTAGGNTSLVGYWSSGTSINGSGIISDSINTDPDNNVDSDDNGATTFSGSAINYVSSPAVTLGGDAEPTGEADVATTWQGASDNRANMTVDFGFYRTAIGDLVYVDANKDGTYVNNVGTGEIPLLGATVQLFASDGTTQVGSNFTTTATGIYSFTGLPAGDYIVKVTPPIGYASTVDTANNADTLNPDDNVNNNDNGIGQLIGAAPSPSGVLTMTPGETGTNITVTSGNTTDTSLDFGFVPLRFSLGNRVWYDTNNNSLLDGTEVGIPGVRVQLFNSSGTEILVGPDGVLGTADDATGGMLTDSNGYYIFDNLLAGNYVVRVPADNFRNIGAGDTVASDPLKGYRSSGTTIAANGTVTDSTANDPNDNIDSDDNGRTTFTGLAVNYVASAAVTLGPDATEPTTDSDPLTNPALTGEEANNQSNRTVDFGFYRVEIGNLVFVDNVTKNGAYDVGETLLSGASVVLYASNGTTQIQVGADGILGFGTDNAAAYVTGAGGTYSFTGLPAGSYVVKVTPPAAGIEYASTLDTAAPTDTTNPNYNVDNNDNGIGENAGQVSSGSVANALTMTPGGGTKPDTTAKTNVVVTNATAITTDPTVDFGFVVTKYYLGNRVWFDTNNNGVIDFLTEKGVSGVRVELYRDTNTSNTYDAGDTYLNFATTDASGYYRFDDLDAGNYVVVLPNDDFTVGGTTDTLVGYWSSGTTISAANVRSDSTVNDPDTTATDSDDNGRTTFTGGVVTYVASGAVTLGATAEPTGETDLSATGQGTTYDNRANMTVDFGFYNVAIGNLVFTDENGNGTYDAGIDALMSGATVQLFASNGTTEILVGQDGIPGTADDAVSFVTDATGSYLFKNLPAGDYIVKVTPPSGYISTVDTASPADTTTPNTNVDNNDNGIGTLPGQASSGALPMNPVAKVASASITKDNLTGITTDTSLDFGFTKVYSLGNRVWYDTNNNSVLDAGESGVPNTRVELYHDTNSNGAYDAGTDISVGFVNTDASGYYRFDNLLAGDYVVVIPADNFTVGATTDALVGYWSSGTSIAASGVTSDSTSLIANDPDNNIDNDDNGVTTFSASAINYVSSAAVTLGADAEPTTDNDPLPNPALTGEAPNNRSNRTLDFGFYRVGIGDLTFIDTDTSGANNAGDLVLAGATVQVFASDASGTTTTELKVGVDGIWNTADDNSGSLVSAPTGLYSIQGLPAGNYVVKVTPPVGYASTIDSNPQNDNDNPNYNVNDNDNGPSVDAGQVSSNVLTMTPGGGTATGGGAKTVTILNGTTTDNTLDFGFVTPLYSLGNRVWLDTNNNGVIEASESGVSGVRVEVYLDNGTTAGVYDAGDTHPASGWFTSTDANGYYRFDGLPTGKYLVVIPNDNFVTGGATDALVGYWSSGVSVNSSGVLTESATNSPDNDQDASSDALTSDENGVTTFTSTALSSANPINYVSSTAVTLGPDTSEPTGETAPNGQGTNDNRANMTVDFGFYGVGIGNLVFVDAEVFDGTYDSATDSLLSGATVDLYASNGSTLLRSVTTLADGLYSFSGLPTGDYIVKVTPPAGFASTVDTADSADTTNPNTNTDNNDNGSGTAIGQVTSGALTMTPGGGTKPDTTPKTVTITAGITTDNSLDFGFTTLTFSLGNRVWYDTNNNGAIDLLTEKGISGVSVELYQDTNANNAYDAGIDISAAASATTDANGYYRFDHLLAGNYVVVIPHSQFTAAPLLGYWSSGTLRADDGTISDSTDLVASDADTNTTDSNDNGVTTFSGSAINYVSSAAVTIGPATDEPTGETDLSPSGQGTLDNRANMTLDFGFYTTDIGDLVFVDLNTNGTYAAGDTKLSGATVALFAGNGTTSLGSVITGADGLYSFSGVPQGNYILKVTPPDGFVSTVDLATTANPDDNIDNDDNGITESIPGQVSSGTLVMTPGEMGASATGATTDLTVDFGFKAAYSLGNRVWFDTNNNSQFDSASEVGAAGVLVNLYNADASGYPTGAAIGSKTTDANGYYRFDNLPPADYVVVIPADNFTTGGATDALVGYWSSGTTMDGVGVNHEPTAPSPEASSSDIDDNGTLETSGTFNHAVISGMVTLGNQAEPTSDNDPLPNPALTGEAPNNQSNRTVDFGFYRVEVGNQVFVDLNEDGLYDAATDLPLPYATAKLFASNGTTELDSVATDAAGTYLFTGLPEGDYIVKVTPPSGYSSTKDTADAADTLNPNTNTDNNDNGIGTGTGEAPSNSFNLNPGSSPATPNTTVDASTGTTTNPTLDFGFTVSLAKTIISTSAAHTIGTDVTIGEIITYDITMFVPVGTLTNATVVDVPQTGLAFVDCINISLPAGVTSAKITDGACSAKDGTIVGTSNPLIENDGGLVTFDFGDLTNASAAPQLVTIRYSVIVLDVATNHSGQIRTNSVTWSAGGKIKTVSATPVKIIEPEMTIDKNATPTAAKYGSTITFTIDIAHASQSTADAFDVVVTDQIPAGLTLVPGSVVVSGTATSNPYSYDPITNILKVVWDEFKLGQTGRITFQAIFVGPAPVVNAANVEWTSLAIDPTIAPPAPDQLSPYNTHSNERWYDPADAIDNYAVTDSVNLTLPIIYNDLPRTGFAPNVITQLPAMPEGFAYNQTDLWVEIPRLNLKLNIVGVPYDPDTDGWNLSWLADNAGWLESTAYPTHSGNSALTAHTTLASGLPGPFAKLDTLVYGDQIIVHLDGQKYIYEVRDNKRVRPNEANSVLKHEDYSWLTLITCNTYDETTRDYTYRSVVRAVLVKLVKE